MRVGFGVIIKFNWINCVHVVSVISNNSSWGIRFMTGCRQGGVNGSVGSDWFIHCNVFTWQCYQYSH